MKVEDCSLDQVGKPSSYARIAGRPETHRVVPKDTCSTRADRVVPDRVQGSWIQALQHKPNVILVHRWNGLLCGTFEVGNYYQRTNHLNSWR